MENTNLEHGSALGNIEQSICTLFVLKGSKKDEIVQSLFYLKKSSG